MSTPYGGKLVNLQVQASDVEVQKKQASDIPLLTLNKRQLCDLELLMNGAYSPLTGFMSQAEYLSVLKDMRLASGLLWSIPIVLDIPESQATALSEGDRLGLVDQEGFMLAILDVGDVWKVDKAQESQLLFGTDDPRHPGVNYLNSDVKEYYVGGQITGLHAPIHYDFEVLRKSPAELRSYFEKMGWTRTLAFSTGKPMHKVHHEITSVAARQIGANILIHPLVGTGKPGELEYFTRVHCYQAIMDYYPKHTALLSLLPYSTRMAGPREAIHSAIVRQNYGCSHILIGPEHGSPPETRQGGKRYYERYKAQQLIDQYKNELEIIPVPIEETCYVPERDQFVPEHIAEDSNDNTIRFSDSELKESLLRGKEVPEWFSYPEVITELKKIYRPRNKIGLTLFFTGLSGSGKSTLAKLVFARFIEDGNRPVTLLDGDVVRTYLSSELGFSKEHRDINVKRIGFVASEINKNGGIAICAPIAPYAEVRDYVRTINSRYGDFIEIHVATPLEVCEKRDRKGLYAKARRGEIKQFTGISDPYEEPLNPEIKIDTSKLSPTEAAQQIMLYLINEGYVDQ